MSKLFKRQRGFTLIELLIVIAIIGIIAALLIPNFLDALHKAKQKQTVGNVKDTGTAWMSWLTDQFGAAAAAGTPAKVSLSTNEYGYDAVKGDLTPQYIQEVPETDGWGGAIKYCRAAGIVAVRQTQAPNAALGIVAPARDGTDGGCAAYDAESFDPTDYGQDIVWADGFFVRYPQRTT